jgi:hypothetical protein
MTGGRLSRAVAAVGLLLHKPHARAASLFVTGEHLLDGWAPAEQLSEHEGVLDRHRCALSHVR